MIGVQVNSLTGPEMFPRVLPRYHDISSVILLLLLLLHLCLSIYTSTSIPIPTIVLLV